MPRYEEETICFGRLWESNDPARTDTDMKKTTGSNLQPSACKD